MLAVLFEMDGRLWGADARLIETVIPAVRLRPVQGAPEWVAGALITWGWPFRRQTFQP